MSISNLLCLPGLVAIARPRLVLSIVICIGAIFLISLTRLSFESNIIKSFSSESRYSRDYAEFLSSLGFSPKQFIILAKSTKPLAQQDFTTLRELAFEFELTDSVSSVYSLASIRFPKNHHLYPNAPLLPLELDTEIIAKRLDALTKAGLRVPISSSRDSALFVVSFVQNSNDGTTNSAIEKLRDVVTNIGGSKLRYHFTSKELIGPEMTQALQRDLIVINIVGTLIAIVLALLIFGNFNLMIIAIVPALFSVLGSLAVFSILNSPINVLSMIIPILVLVLALADTVHLTLHFANSDLSVAKETRIKSSIVVIGPACALTAITTSIAFAATGISDNAQLKDLAVIGAISVVLAYLIVIVSFPLLALFFNGNNTQIRSRDWLIIPNSWPERVLKNSRLVYVLCTFITVLSLIGISNLYPWFKLDENLPTTSEVRHTNLNIAKDFGGIYRIWSELDVSGENQLASQTGWNRLVKLTDAIEISAGHYPVISLATIAKWQGAPDKMLSKEMLKQLPVELRNQLLSKDGETARVITVAPEPMFNRQTLIVQKKIENEAILNGARRNIGLPIIMRYESVAVVIQLCLGLAIALLTSVILVATFFRRLSLVAMLTLPNVLPLAVAAASLALFRNGELTPAAMLALTVAFGIAIDDSIHFVNRFLIEQESGHDTKTALKTSIQQTGKAMIVTTVLICAGLIVTMFSSFENIRLFGTMLILTFVTALFADLFLLPNLLKHLEKRL